jgi:hypothetical protein
MNRPGPKPQGLDTPTTVRLPKTMRARLAAVALPGEELSATIRRGLDVWLTWIESLRGKP